MRRSFTLLETVIAAALLAMLAASSASALRVIATAAGRSADAIDVGALSLAVDELLADPEAHGLPELTDGAAWDGLEAQSPGDHALPIAIRRVITEHSVAIPAGAEPRPSAWLVFESGSAAVVRWLPLPAPKETPPAPQEPAQ